VHWPLSKTVPSLQLVHVEVEPEQVLHELTQESQVKVAVLARYPVGQVVLQVVSYR